MLECRKSVIVSPDYSDSNPNQVCRVSVIQANPNRTSNEQKASLQIKEKVESRGAGLPFQLSYLDVLNTVQDALGEPDNPKDILAEIYCKEIGDFIDLHKSTSSQYKCNERSNNCDKSSNVQHGSGDKSSSTKLNRDGTKACILNQENYKVCNQHTARKDYLHPELEFTAPTEEFTSKSGNEEQQDEETYEFDVTTNTTVQSSGDTNINDENSKFGHIRRGGGKRRGRKKGYRSEHTNREGTICNICGDQAGRHSYYGGVACQSCRAFFRRSVQGGNYQKFRCIKLHNQCSLKHSFRKKCKFCRFQSCIGAGMKVSYVVSRKEGRASMVDPSTYHQPVHFHMDSNSTTSTATDHDQESCFTTDEYSEFSPEVGSNIYRLWDECRIPCLPDEHMTRLQMEKYLESRWYELVERLSSGEVISSLLPLHSFQCCSGVEEDVKDSSKESKISILSILSQILMPRQPLCWSSWFLDLIGANDQDVEDSESIEHFSYEENFPNGWCVSPDLEERHRLLWTRIEDTISDKVIYILLVLSVVYSSDHLLHAITRILQGYIWSVSKENFRSEFGDCLLVPAWIEEIKEINQLRIL